MKEETLNNLDKLLNDVIKNPNTINNSDLINAVVNLADSLNTLNSLNHSI